jgi:mono/diheme cytochrome c family protein
MPSGRGASEPRVLLHTALVLLGVYLGIRYGLPWISVWVGVSQNPAPTPAFAIAIYMTCAVAGALVYVSADTERWRHFLGPIVRLLAGTSGERARLRLLVLALLPALAGWMTWQRVRPAPRTPAALRVQHPAMPDAFAALENPLRALPAEERREAEREGVVLYQKNCRPCHGTKADGGGPLARGLRLRPVDFTDPGTIATVVEPYPFWRIKRGALGLPGMATPWHSAMPAWEDELEDDEIWRIIMAEYAIAGREPRVPEGTER